MWHPEGGEGGTSLHGGRHCEKLGKVKKKKPTGVQESKTPRVHDSKSDQESKTPSQSLDFKLTLTRNTITSWCARAGGRSAHPVSIFTQIIFNWHAARKQDADTNSTFATVHLSLLARRRCCLGRCFAGAGFLAPPHVTLLDLGAHVGHEAVDCGGRRVRARPDEGRAGRAAEAESVLPIISSQREAAPVIPPSSSTLFPLLKRLTGGRGPTATSPRSTSSGFCGSTREGGVRGRDSDPAAGRDGYPRRGRTAGTLNRSATSLGARKAQGWPRLDVGDGEM